MVRIKNENLYYVGGVVRDELLGLPSFDTDFCYEGNAIEFAKDFNVIKINPNFGTVRIKSEEGEIDIASTRTEIYPKAGHLPVVESIGCPLEEDLKRRDFTINALAKNTVTGDITDFFGGLDDLKSKKLRVLHDKSFIDDPSRIIRGLKFSVRFGFELEEHTLQLQKEYLTNINYDVSYHRIKKELKETLNLNDPKTYDIFIEQGIYKLLGKGSSVPKISVSSANILNNKFTPTYPYMVYLGLFDLSNFELTGEELKILNSYNEIKGIKLNNDLEIYKTFSGKPLESILLYALTENMNVALNYLENLSSIKIDTTGDDLIKLGISQGKVYKEIFDYILECKLKNPQISKEEELLFVKERFL